MLLATVPSRMPGPFVSVPAKDVDSPKWEETCDPGRLWLRTLTHDETIIEEWIAYISHSQKLICAPRSCEKSLADSQLARMTGLHVDWDAEGGEPPNQDAYTNAREVLTVAGAISMPVEYTTASTSGGIAICLKRGDVYADVECFNSGEIWAIVSRQQEAPQTWQLEADRNTIESSLRRIALIIHQNA